MNTAPNGTATYQVVEELPQASASHGDQIAVAGRSPDGIHLLLTEQAAAQLAHFLIGTTITDPGRLQDHIESGIDDPHLWAHVAVDLLIARAHNVHQPREDNVAYVTRGDAQSGYLRPLRSAPTAGGEQ